MNVIDLEILIPASPEFIWRFLGDLSIIPQWQQNVSSVSFLSTQREGNGTRWRQSALKGNDIVVEVSAWYDTLGYEYKLVDGSKLGENQGRIRLQEVAEGTLVRWTFQYDPGGVFGGLRNTVRLKRNTNKEIQTSLRNLHQLILQESGGISTHQAKSSMQDAPDVDERSAYQPRHPLAYHEPFGDEVTENGDDFDTEKQSIAPYDMEPALPPPTDIDTKPNPVVLSSQLEQEVAEETEFKLEDTQPVEAVSLSAEPMPEVPTAPEPDEANLPEPPSAIAQPASSPEAQEQSDLSVFEIFGLQKPSEANSVSDEGAEPAQQSYESDAVLDEILPFADSASPSKAPATMTQDSDDANAESSPTTADGKILGLRRCARRAKPSLRTHSY